MPTISLSARGAERLKRAVQIIEGGGWDPAVERPSRHFSAQMKLAVADGTVSPGGSGSFSWYYSTSVSTTETDSTKNFTAYDWLRMGIQAGERCLIFRPIPSPRWYAIAPRMPRQLLLAFADEDIKHNGKGTVKLAVGQAGLEVAGTVEVEVFNTTGSRIWDGAPVVITYITQAGATDGDWHIVRDYSAHHVKGKAYGSIAEGAWGTIDDVHGIDGYFPDTSINVMVLDETGDVEDNEEVVAHWDEVTERWWIHGSGGGGGDDFDKRVKVSSDEPLTDANTGQYLEEQFFAHRKEVPPVFDEDKDIQVVSETVYFGTPPNHTDEMVRWYWESDQINCYTAGQTEFLIHNDEENDQVQWATHYPMGTYTNTSNDKDLFTHNDWNELDVCTEHRAFIDASEIKNYDGYNEQVLGHESDGTWKWFTICPTTVVVDTRLNGTHLEKKNLPCKVIECGTPYWDEAFPSAVCTTGTTEMVSDSGSASASPSASVSHSPSGSASATPSYSPSSSASLSGSASESSSQSYSQSGSASRSESSSTSESGLPSCGGCGTTYPNAFQVTISGLVLTGGDCNVCEELNDTFVMPLSENSDGTTCIYGTSSDQLGMGIEEWDLVLTFRESGGTYSASLTLHITNHDCDEVHEIVFTTSQGTAFDCPAIEDFALTYDDWNSVYHGDILCDASSATVTITAL